MDIAAGEGKTAVLSGRRADVLPGGATGARTLSPTGRSDQEAKRGTLQMRPRRIGGGGAPVNKSRRMRLLEILRNVLRESSTSALRY